MQVKMTLTIVMPGRVMMVPKEARKNLKENYEHSSIVVDTIGKNGKKTKETLYIHTRKCIPATQVINMSDEAYAYMTDKKDCPEWFIDKTHNARDWAKLSNEQRLRLHLKRTAEHLGGSHFTYEIFPD